MCEGLGVSRCLCACSVSVNSQRIPLAHNSYGASPLQTAWGMLVTLAGRGWAMYMQMPSPPFPPQTTVPLKHTFLHASDLRSRCR